MFVDVYFHRTRRIWTSTLPSSRDLLPGNTYPAAVEEFLEWDDTAILRAASFGPNRAARHCSEFFREWIIPKEPR